MCIMITVEVGVGERQLGSETREREREIGDDLTHDENEGIAARTFVLCVVGIGPKMWRDGFIQDPTIEPQAVRVPKSLGWRCTGRSEHCFETRMCFCNRRIDEQLTAKGVCN
jgi:hypothetical protein